MTYSVKEAANYINNFKPISDQMVRHYLRTRRIKGVYKGRMWFIEKAELNRFIKSYVK